VKAAASVALAGTCVAALLTWSDYPREAVYMAGIFMLAASLWVTEALPLFVTALLVVGLQIVVLANPGGWPHLGFAAGPSPSVQEVVSGAADSVLLLFLGGLMLARGAERTDIGRVLSGLMLSRFTGRPPLLLLAVMALTATFSMWMSNTATAAMMMALIAPLLAGLTAGDPFRKALALGVPFAANIGGLSTPIASPPNAIAVGYLQSAGHPITFFEWMLVAMPLLALLLLITWLLLWRAFPPSAPIEPLPIERVRLTRPRALVMGTFGVTVALWMTGGWHGLPPAVVALVPIVVLTASGVLTPHDVNRLDWTVLILIAGGISLGAGMRMTGLDAVIVGWLPFDAANHPRAVAVVLVGAVLVLGTVMSNTAVANLLLPVGMSAGLSSGSSAVVVQLTVSIALAASLAMALPISTPPNAIAYARGEITTRDMARTGVAIGIISGVLILVFGPWVMRFWGVG
jgi:sodium-dependent dicarboxylate transporter 2/3/5